MKIKLLKFETTSSFKINKARGVNEETKYKYKKVNIGHFSSDVEIEFKIPLTELGPDKDEYSIATALYLITDVPLDNNAAAKTVIQVATNEVRKLIKELMIQLKIEKTLKIDIKEEKDIDFFEDEKENQDKTQEEINEDNNNNDYGVNLN